MVCEKFRGEDGNTRAEKATAAYAAEE